MSCPTRWRRCGRVSCRWTRRRRWPGTCRPATTSPRPGWRGAARSGSSARPCPGTATRSRTSPSPVGTRIRRSRGSVATGLRRSRATDAHIRLPEAAGAVVDQALKAMHEDLKRKPEPTPPTGSSPHRSTRRTRSSPWPRPRCARVKRPGRARTGTWSTPTSKPAPTGVQLMTHLGIVLPEGQRRHLLCDARLRATFHGDDAAPVEHRAGHPGHQPPAPPCHRAPRRRLLHRARLRTHHRLGDPPHLALGRRRPHRHLQPHHPLRLPPRLPPPRHPRHHRQRRPPPPHRTRRRVHQPTGARPLDPAGQPNAPEPAPSGTDPSERTPRAAHAAGIAPHRYQPPTGERLDRSGFHLQEQPAHPETGPAPDDDPPVDDPPPPDASTTGRPPRTLGGPSGPDTRASSDPTRAGPAAA